METFVEFRKYQRPPESNGKFEMSLKISKNSSPPESCSRFENTSFPRDTINTVDDDDDDDDDDKMMILNT